jgi:hypothetical protein
VGGTARVKSRAARSPSVPPEGMYALHKPSEADALQKARDEQEREAAGRGAEQAAERHHQQPGEREALVAEPVAHHAGDHAHGHAHDVEGRGDEPRLHQRKAELGAHRGQRRSHLGHVGAGGEAGGEDVPDRSPVGDGRSGRFGH